MGSRNCIYYITCYNTKWNQEEDQFPFLRHYTEIAHLNPDMLNHPFGGLNVIFVGE
jgi:hypothetical protein